jgi:hypothetical protein
MKRMKTRFSLSEILAAIRRNVRSKTILVSGQPVKLYSVDGRTWFSEAKIYTEYRSGISCRERSSLVGNSL